MGADSRRMDGALDKDDITNTQRDIQPSPSQQPRRGIPASLENIH